MERVKLSFSLSSINEQKAEHGARRNWGEGTKRQYGSRED